MNDNSPTGTYAARIAVLLPSLKGATCMPTGECRGRGRHGRCIARAQLDKPIDKDILRRWAEYFSVNRAVGNYLDLLDAVVAQVAKQK